jgi:hypothetical protein
MKGPRYAKQVDDNQRQIVNELKQIPGVSVCVIGQPVDLLVGYQARNFLIEIKREDKRDRPSAVTKAQREFFGSWTGQVRIAASAEEIIDLITKGYRHAKPK